MGTLKQSLTYFQIENEYGSYFACDKVYLKFLESFYKEFLVDDVVLFSVDDGFRGKEIECGSLSTTFKTVDFGPTKDVVHGFDILKKLQPNGPLVSRFIVNFPCIFLTGILWLRA